MNRFIGVMSLVACLGLAGCAGFDQQRYPRINCPQDPGCIPVDPDDPAATPFEFGVQRGAVKEIAFPLATDTGSGSTWVIFKCQRMDENNPDCRTPLEDNKGNPLWAIRLVTAGTPAGGFLQSPLEQCDACLDNSNNPASCEANACRYPYMIIDLKKPTQQPVDPVIIVR